MWTALPSSCRRLNSSSGDLEWGHAQKDNTIKNNVTATGTRAATERTPTDTPPHDPLPSELRRAVMRVRFSRHVSRFTLTCTVLGMCLAHVPFAIGRAIQLGLGADQ